MNFFTKVTAVVLLSLPLLASAAGKSASASMQVTFEVKESCNVQTAADTRLAPSPAVACQLNTPYLVTRAAAPAATSAPQGQRATATRPEAGASDVTVVYF